jgi:DME family drug/metabolite transporter
VHLSAQSSQVRGTWLVLAAAILWGTTGTAQALAPPGAQPASVGAVRLLFGGLILLVIALLRGALRRTGRWPLVTTLIAGASMAAYQMLFFAGVARTGVAVGTIVGIGSSPILAGVIGFLVRDERPGKTWAVATALSVTGCGLLITAGESIQIDLGGILLAIGAGAAYAVFTVVSKGLLQERDPQAVMAVTFNLGTILILPLILSIDLSWLLTPGGMAVAVHLGLITVGIAYSLFAQGLKLVPVATAATLTLAEPLTAGFLGVVVLGERLTMAAAVGITLIFSGLAVLTTANGNWRVRLFRVR